ncbi:unnamed protein product [Oikopleura dioica]|nr:unnamed protein product [Oikopleura dioica]
MNSGNSDFLPLGFDDKPKPGMRVFQKFKEYFRKIIKEKDTRNLFFFICINLSFAFVELFYGLWTNSLGLISDAFHMFFDCSALLLGLVAAVVARWRPNDRYTYGYVRADTLAGFVNAVFLVFIAFFILSEAIERLVEPVHIHHEKLLSVSVMGLLVNIIGIFVFAHGGSHGHSHGGHGHSHGGDSHGHSHGHVSAAAADHGKLPFFQTGNMAIMQGAFLHILADTMGSVGVIISTLLIDWFGWHRADPIASIFIALMTLISVKPLLTETTTTLLQRSPPEFDDKLPIAYSQLLRMEGVERLEEAHCWTLAKGQTICSVKIKTTIDANPRKITQDATNAIKSAGVQRVFIHLN